MHRAGAVSVIGRKRAQKGTQLRGELLGMLVLDSRHHFWNYFPWPGALLMRRLQATVFLTRANKAKISSTLSPCVNYILFLLSFLICDIPSQSVFCPRTPMQHTQTHTHTHAHPHSHTPFFLPSAPPSSINLSSRQPKHIHLILILHIQIKHSIYCG